MTCLKKQYKVILFFIVFSLTTQVLLMIKLNQMVRTLENFEPVIIEQNQPIVDAKPVSKEVYIDCPLDDETQQMIKDKCEEYDIEFPFAMAVMFKESSFRPDVISYNNTSVGLMQINYVNHPRLSETLGLTDFFDPEQNVTAGLFMLRELFDKYEDPAKVLMAYNMGEAGAKRLWKKGIITSDYAEGILKQTEIYEDELKKGWVNND